MNITAIKSLLRTQADLLHYQQIFFIYFSIFISQRTHSKLFPLAAGYKVFEHRNWMNLLGIFQWNTVISLIHQSIKSTQIKS